MKWKKLSEIYFAVNESMYYVVVILLFIFNLDKTIFVYIYIYSFFKLENKQKIPTRLRRLRKSSLSLWYMQFRRKWRGNGFRRNLKLFFLLHICYNMLQCVRSCKICMFTFFLLSFVRNLYNLYVYKLVVLIL